MNESLDKKWYIAQIKPNRLKGYESHMNTQLLNTITNKIKFNANKKATMKTIKNIKTLKL